MSGKKVNILNHSLIPDELLPISSCLTLIRFLLLFFHNFRNHNGVKTSLATPADEIIHTNTAVALACLVHHPSYCQREDRDKGEEIMMDENETLITTTTMKTINNNDKNEDISDDNG